MVLHVFVVLGSAVLTFAGCGLALASGHMFSPGDVTRVAAIVASIACGTAAMALTMPGLNKEVA